MSASTPAMLAQVSGGFRSLRGSVGSSTAEAVSPHPSLREMLALFNLPASKTVQELYDLLLKFDYECLQYATGIAQNSARDSTSDVDSVVEFALYLSGAVSQCGYPGTFLFQEMQLRALISSLAVLHHKEIQSLDPEIYDNLRFKNLSARFQKITFQVQGSSNLADKIRLAPNPYLAQLASQYASFIGRGDSFWPSVFGPVKDILFSILSLGGGSYKHIRDLIGGIDSLLSIWQTPQTKYQALCGLQEYSRVATTLCRESAIADDSSELRKAAAAFVAALVDKVDEILAAENGTFPSSLARRWHVVLAFISRGPPDLDQGYFYYGLLDCVSQLAAVSDPQLLGVALRGRVKDLIFESVVPEFRWKAIEIILSSHCTRQEQCAMLKRDIETRDTVETKARIREEIRIIQSHLENDEQELLRFKTPRPLTRVSPTMPSDPGGPPVTEIAVSTTPESALSRSFIKGYTSYSLHSVRKSKKSWNSAGLFEDCRHAFFYNNSEISVWNLGDIQKQPTSPNFSMVFDKHQEMIRYAASSRSYIIIVTDKRLLTYHIDAPTPIDVKTHGKWDPSGLACHESEAYVVGFLGQCQMNEQNMYNGRVLAFRYRKGSPIEKLPASVLEVPASDCPKRFSFHADSRLLICITRLQNKLLIWRLDDEFSSSLEPSEFLKNHYTAGTGETGVTSAAIYQSPSRRPYVLCATAPSTDRYHHNGEWSFILPIPSSLSGSLQDQGTKVHNFEQLENHRPLFAGCSSSQHHIFAILENSGKTSILRLEKHDDGGIHSTKDAEPLAHSLCKQDRPLTDCLRFDPSGSCLFAVDPKGKIIITEFAKK